MDNNQKVKKSEKFRHAFQFLWGLVTNSYFAGFLQGKIYGGKLKNLCLPGLNCYSCPGALGSCPIGALQSVIGSRNYKFSFYVCGFFIFIGSIMGRFVCGWLCPFGFIQDVLHKIPFPKKLKTFKGDKLLKKLKYVILAVFVVLLPMVAVDATGLGDPWFCKYICPSGTLEGGVPLVVLGEGFRSIIGWLYTWKLLILAVTLFLSIIIYRPFCKYICPLGGIYALFNKVSVFKMKFDEDKCISCKKCVKECKMNVDPTKSANHSECIRCGVCVNTCPTNALKFSWIKDEKPKLKDKKSPEHR